jgi:hypothetical protein
MVLRYGHLAPDQRKTLMLVRLCSGVRLLVTVIFRVFMQPTLSIRLAGYF